jgi:hypothetical protein
MRTQKGKKYGIILKGEAEELPLSLWKTDEHVHHLRKG